MSGAEDERLVELATVIHRDLAESRRAAIGSGRRDVTVEQAIRQAVAERAAVLAEPTREELAERISRDTIGLGPLEDLLDDPEVEEVMVNGGGEVYVERSGRIDRSTPRLPG
jgi:pilus assembly protein CpaF